MTHTGSAGESVENYTLKTREQGILFEIVETNMTPLSDGERYRGEGTSMITAEVNTTDSVLEWFWEIKNYSAFETRALEAFSLTVVTETAIYEGENSFVYTEFDPPTGYPGVEMYDAEMVTFGGPQYVFNYSTPDGSFTLVSDRSEDYDLSNGLNYSRVRKHLTEDLNLTTDKIDDVCPETTDELTVEVVSGERRTEATVEVPQAPSVSVELTNVPADVQPGEEIEIGYTVANTGEAAGSLNISLRRDGQVVATERACRYRATRPCPERSRLRWFPTMSRR